MVDYGKWDDLELTDSDDADEVHPNIDKKSWFRLQREITSKDREERSSRINAIKRELIDLQKSDNYEAKRKIVELESELAKLQAKVTADQMKWRPSSIRETFNKTIINEDLSEGKEINTSNIADLSDRHSDVASTEVIDNFLVDNSGEKLSELTEKKQKEEEDAFVAAMERKAWGFVDCEHFTDIESYLTQNSDIVSSETDTYLLLHARDAYKTGKRDLSYRLVHHSLLVRYILDLVETLHLPVPQAIHVLLSSFKKDAKPKQAFLDDLDQFWKKFSHIQDNK